MEILINTLEPTPVYEQIVQQVEQTVIQGKLPSGSALPSIRQLANDMELNPNTVAKAYQILERNRIIFTAGRKGTFIHKDAAKNASEGQKMDLKDQFSKIIYEAQAKGLSELEIQKIFKIQIKETFKGES